MRRLATLTATLALTFLASAAARADEVDDYLEGEMARLHIPSLALAVVRDGRVIKAQGYGLADRERQVSASTETVYEIGSLSKQFAAAAVLMLVEEGRVGLDDPITRYFPQAPPSWGRLTVRHLLHHTSGLASYVDLPDSLAVAKSEPSTDEVLAWFYELPIELAPGETWSYSNTGYYLLGLIVERVSGMSYWQFLAERIFRPLGMASTRTTDDASPLRAAGYAWRDGAFEPRAPLATTTAHAAGALASTVLDLARWSAALDDDALLTAASRELMWTPARTHDGGRAPFDYGFGWFLDDDQGHRVQLHSGGTPGFSSSLYRYPDDRLAVILLCNHEDRLIEQMAVDVAGMFVPALKRTVRARDPDAARTDRLWAVTARLLAGRPDPAAFTPAMNRFLRTTTGHVWWQWIGSHGELTALDFAREEGGHGNRTVRYRATLGDTRLWLSYRLAADGKVAQITSW
jgi:CubicO group peptidase (beta-lactamase class C family)